MNWTALKSWAFDRLQEKSTWAGLVVGASTLLGVSIAPAKAEIIETLGLTITAAALVGTKEAVKPSAATPAAGSAGDAK